MQIDNSLPIRERALDPVDNPRCLNYPKVHLWRLPDIPKDKFVPSYPGDSKMGLVLFHLFSMQDPEIEEVDRTLEHHAVRSALWARRSWMLFTDVGDQDIACKFYVEQQVRGRVMPILEASGCSESDVIFYDGEPFEPKHRVYRSHCSKKIAPYMDERFTDYDWVLLADADMFVASPERKKMRLFEWLRNQPRQLGCLSAHYGRVGETLDDLQFHLWPKLESTEWYHRVEELAGRDVMSIFRTGSDAILRTHGALQFFPSKAFHENRKADCQFIFDAGKSLLNDEAALSVWAMSQPENTIWSFALSLQEAEADSPVSVIEYEELRQTRDHVIREGDVYFSHFNVPQEWLWRWDIDAL